MNPSPYLDLRCHNCSSTLLDRIGAELYCLECDTVNNQLHLDCRFVPAPYQPNSKPRNQLDMERRIDTHLREFLGKYGLGREEKALRERVLRMKRETPNSKGTRQAAAVVVFCARREESKMSILDFCKENHLRHRMFNQKYLVYHRLFASREAQTHEHSSEEREAGGLIKMEVKVDESHLFALAAKHNEEAISEPACPSSSPLQDQGRRAIEIIFDSLFPNFYLREKKQLIIHKLITKINQVPSHFFAQAQGALPLRLYYLIFVIVKSLGYKISFERYREIIRGKAGYLLKKEAALSTKKHYQQLTQQKKSQSSPSPSPQGVQVSLQRQQLIEVYGIKIEDNNPVPRIKFPVADSENQFSYEYYFEDEFNW